MPLVVGTKLGSYEILSLLGTGGMGEVYLALDPKLDREVALKVLPTELSRDLDRMARFRREAQVLASFSHPHIASVYGLEDSGAIPALVMELVEGPTLADRAALGPIPIEESLTIAKQIAEALEYAHERGVVHRDLKPANVKLTAEGDVKVLDFGLAKVLQPESADNTNVTDSPTLTSVPTQIGVILGTAAYMSPEQAKGKRVDRRTDIWALGCMLFEMLTGKACFQGETVTDTLAVILREEPDWTQLPAETPAKACELLRRCLTKDVKQRLQAIGDARITLEETIHSPQPSLRDNAAATPSNTWRSFLPWALVGVCAIALLITLAAWWKSCTRPAPGAMKFELALAPGQSFNFEGHPPLAISPDGSHLAYSIRKGSTAQIYVRALDSVEAKPLPGTDGAFGPFFSPDGQWVAFFARGKLWKVPVRGGPVFELCDVGGNPRGGSWSSNGNIYAAISAISGLVRVPQDGGQPVTFTTLNLTKGDRTHRWPQALPDGDHVLFTVGTMDSPEGYDDSEIAVVSSSTGKRSIVLKGARMAFFVPTGHLIYARGDVLYAVPFDLRKLQVRGTAAPLVQNVSGDTSDGASFVGISERGLVYLSGSDVTDRSTLAWVDRTGKIVDLPAPSHHYRDMRISPDGKQVAIGISERSQDIWIYDFARNTMNRLTFEGENQLPLWTADGKGVFYSTNAGATRHELKWTPVDGSSPPEKLEGPDTTVRVPTSVSSDGSTLAYTAFPDNNASAPYMMSLSLTGEHKSHLLFNGDSSGHWPTFSPDGHWLAYAGKQGLQTEIFVQPNPPTGGRWQVSSQGGTEPLWSADGKEIFYRDPNDTVMVLRVETRGGFHTSTPQEFYKGLYRASGALQNYAVSRDGQRALVLRSLAGSDTPKYSVLILNWLEELRRVTNQRN
jgi:eukaryotic-like serine/threonine-protein kinase